MSCGSCGPKYVVPANGAAPTDENEEAVLREEFGDVNSFGVYGAIEPGEDD